MTPLARKFLHDFSIEAATTRIAILYIVGIVPACMIFLRPDPARYGEGPDGVALSSTGDSPNQQLTQRNGAEFDHAVKSPAFRAITIGFLCALGAQVGGIAQLDKLAHERIASESSAARILSIVAFCSVVGRLSGSVIVSRIGARRFTYCYFIRSFSLQRLVCATIRGSTDEASSTQRWALQVDRSCTGSCATMQVGIARHTLSEQL
jgi:nitrate/nitrite transporter NarK